MMLRFPDFIVIGAEKAGTTWLSARLNEQCGIAFSRPFEISFFDNEGNYAKGPGWYASHFSHTGNCELVGEKTPGYFWTMRPASAGSSDIAERMHALLPNTKLIVIFRDPVDRGISAFNHYVRTRDISPFADPDPIMERALDIDEDPFGLVSQGLYAQSLTRYLSVYPREQIQTLFFEDDIVKRPMATVARTLQFLGQPTDSQTGHIMQPNKAGRRFGRWWPENKRMHSRIGLVLNYYAPKITPIVSAIDRFLPEQAEIRPSPKMLQRLREFFAPQNQQLFNLINRRTEAWGKDDASCDR